MKKSLYRNCNCYFHDIWDFSLSWITFFSKYNFTRKKSIRNVFLLMTTHSPTGAHVWHSLHRQHFFRRCFHHPEIMSTTVFYQKGKPLIEVFLPPQHWITFGKGTGFRTPALLQQVSAELLLNSKNKKHHQTMPNIPHMAKLLLDLEPQSWGNGFSF